jgi:murein L,D-transpeptidase YcbB/YkuD
MKIKITRIVLSGILIFVFFDLALIQNSASPADTQQSVSSEGLSNDYVKLNKALLFYNEIAEHGGWPSVSEGALLKKGDRGERVVRLRKRLVITGDFQGETAGDEAVYDEELRNAVIRFQRRHGLKDDGVVGPDTLKDLNVSVGERIEQIEINLKRLKQMPQHLDTRYIAVNIAAFELDVVENENTVMSMKVIVGKQYWHSPLFSAKMTYIVFNPSWYVPNSIAIKEILPKIKDDPGYLVNEGIKVFEKGKGYRNELDASAINWADVNADNLIYRFVQVPGIRNPLGKIKFVFPNEYNVYLHDTPAKVLFEKSSRAFSHGCIRIEKPFELAEYLLHDDPAWTRENILAVMESGEDVKIKIPSPINVHVLYLTAWVDKDNILQFRKDVYGRDK